MALRLRGMEVLESTAPKMPFAGRVGVHGKWSRLSACGSDYNRKLARENDRKAFPDYHSRAILIDRSLFI